MIAEMLASDPESDGKFVVGVKTTGVYCLPSCRPPRKPKPENVEFYASPEEARAAGFRPCKLCKPDDFYNGHHAEEALIEELVAEVLGNPGEFEDVSALAARAGVGNSKLYELFREHYHTTPAELLARARVVQARGALLDSELPVVEIAFGAGFQSLSAFNENFRKHSAMAPLAYRRLAERPVFELALPPDYPRERILRYLGRDRQSLTERVVDDHFTTALRLGDGEAATPATVEIRLAAGIAHCRVASPEALCPTAAERLHEQVLATLGLTLDPARFEAQIVTDPELAPLLAGQRGLRIPQVADPFDALLRAIIGQQINLAFAAKLRRRLVERFGAPAGEGLFLPPNAARLASIEPADLTALGFSRPKAEHLVGAARAVVERRLPLVELAGKSAVRVERTLREVRGIGPWTAHYVMMRSFGFLDCTPVGDTGLTAGLQQFFALPERPGKPETLRLMERFSPYRSLATFHLWQRVATAA